MVNGQYRRGLHDLSDMGCCGCGSAGTMPATEPHPGFDLSSVPTWAWIAAAVVGGFMLLKKK